MLQTLELGVDIYGEVCDNSMDVIIMHVFML